MSTANLDKIETFINDTNAVIIDARGGHTFAQNITTSIAWSMAAAFNSGEYFLHNLNKQLVEAQEEGNADRIEQVKDLMTRTERNNEEARDAYAWAANYIYNTTGTPNALNPKPENIIPTFTKASDQIDDYKPSPEMVEYVKKYINVSDTALNLAIQQKASDAKESAELMARWTAQNQTQIIRKLEQALKKERALLDLSDEICVRIWDKIDNKLAEYSQKAIIAMLGKNAKTAKAAMQNIENFEFAQQISSGFVEMYHNLSLSENMDADAVTH